MPEGDQAKLLCSHAFCYPPQSQEECFLLLFQRLRYAELKNEPRKLLVASKLKELVVTIKTDGKNCNCPWLELALQPAIASLKWLGEDIPPM